jgi:hypothetical protein
VEFGKEKKSMKQSLPIHPLQGTSKRREEPCSAKISKPHCLKITYI